MTKCLEIDCSHPYYIHFSKNFATQLDWQAYSRVVVISDSVVGELYAKLVCRQIPLPTELIFFPAGEAYKTRETKQMLEDQLLELGVGRDCLMIALGGGVVLDMVGFLAATYCRGVDVIYLPSSLLAMVDASIGGKTAVNTPYAKNMIGVFSQPQAVFINVDFLRTLPLREFKSGLAEVLKHALIMDKDFLQWMVSEKSNIMAQKQDSLESMIYKSCLLKQQVVMQDEFEQGLRQILNFGHSIAHAIETHVNYNILHGEAVAMGMLVEAYIAKCMGILPISELNKLKQVIELFEFPFTREVFENPIALKTLMLKDKKNKQGQIKMVMLKGIGEVLSFPKTISDSLIDEAFMWACQQC